jgi:hypothetical protein
MAQRDRPVSMGDRDDPTCVLENLALSLRAAFGDAVSVEVADGLMHLTIGRHSALFNNVGDLVGEASAS